ncbi:hypothetical protein KW805_03425 [Candidatus Pacearchaeota archaeon]|nr:hypothetical protein [Candidatus Pacearchaeota archaeon]
MTSVERGGMTRTSQRKVSGPYSITSVIEALNSYKSAPASSRDIDALSLLIKLSERRNNIDDVLLYSAHRAAALASMATSPLPARARKEYFNAALENYFDLAVTVETLADMLSEKPTYYRDFAVLCYEKMLRLQDQTLEYRGRNITEKSLDRLRSAGKRTFARKTAAA